MKTVLIVAGLAVTLIAAGQTEDWADDTFWEGYAESKTLCRAVRDREPPVADRPSPAQAAALAGCSSESLYHGIGRPSDPVRARHCAFVESDEAGPFAGRTMLMTIYANGMGAERDLDVALHLACLTDGAPAERDGRVRHLAELRASGWAGTDFHYCDDITSGLAMGYCAAHQARIANAERAAESARLVAAWTAPERAALERLQDAHGAYATAHGEGEIDLSGTMRAAMQISAEQSLHDELAAMLQTLAANDAPPAGPTLADADAALNLAYRSRLSGEFGDHPGAVSRDGVRNAQRAWLRYRDAFLAFAATKFPAAPRERLAAWLTAQRTDRLASAK